MKRLLAGAMLAATLPLAWAQATPVGLWRTIDDDGKTEKSLVRITEVAGTFTGKVDKLFDAGKQDATCDDCTDARKGQRIVGMTILQGVKASAESGLWDGGEILDPANGKTYKVRLKPVNAGKALEVRGYIGVPMLGRTQTWQRVE